jgi:hypothetical protein
LFGALTAKGIAADLVIEAGLAIRPDEGKARKTPYDRFRNRIIFPIRDGRGRAISLGGRAMDPNDRAKYLNGPETALFDKGRNLFNLFAHGSNLWTVANNLNSNILNCVATLLQKLKSRLNEYTTIRAGKLWAINTKICTDIAKSRSRQHCINDCVTYGVAIAVTIKSALAWPHNGAKVKRF